MNMECRPRRAGRRARRLLAAAALAWPAATAAAPDDATFAAIRAVDLALGRIGWRLATANAALCDRLAPGLGLLLHTPSQYAPRAAARRYFRFAGPVGIEGVVPGSPADAAGLRADDAILAVGGTRLAPDDPRAPTGTAALVDADRRIAALPPDRPVAVEGRRDGQGFVRTVAPLPACRTRFEAAIGPGFPAQADGELVQIGSRFLTDYPEDQAAAVAAHELAHDILRHRARLEAQGVSYGLLAGVGRNVRYFRQTEFEADILSVSLLANAGYDPAAAVRFWQAHGPRETGDALRDRTHPAWRDRVAVLARAIAAIGPERPARPALLATRDRPLDGNWQALLGKR